jgi:hypothetical protein
MRNLIWVSKQPATVHTVSKLRRNRDVSGIRILFLPYTSSNPLPAKFPAATSVGTTSQVLAGSPSRFLPYLAHVRGLHTHLGARLQLGR